MFLHASSGTGDDKRRPYESGAKCAPVPNQPRAYRAHIDGAYSSARSIRISMTTGASITPLDSPTPQPSGRKPGASRPIAPDT